MLDKDVEYNAPLSVLIILYTHLSSGSPPCFFGGVLDVLPVVALNQFRAARRGDLSMQKKKRRGKVSKFGIFSPAVIAAKVALGEGRLNKLRGKVSTAGTKVCGLCHGV